MMHNIKVAVSLLQAQFLNVCGIWVLQHMKFMIKFT